MTLTQLKEAETVLDFVRGAVDQGMLTPEFIPLPGLTTWTSWSSSRVLNCYPTQFRMPKLGHLSVTVTAPRQRQAELMGIAVGTPNEIVGACLIPIPSLDLHPKEDSPTTEVVTARFPLPQPLTDQELLVYLPNGTSIVELLKGHAAHTLLRESIRRLPDIKRLDPWDSFLGSQYKRMPEVTRKVIRSALMGMELQLTRHSKLR